ncbi:MAG: MATE family efflux transporter [Dermatophilaceae bacterium]
MSSWRTSRHDVGRGEGVILARMLVRLAWPLVLSGLVTVLVAGNDTVLLGWLGADAVAMGATASGVYSVAVVFVSGFAIPAQVLSARHTGAGDPAAAARSAGLVVAVALWVSIPLTLLLVVAAGPLVSLVAGDAIDERLAADYLRIIATGLPAVAIVAVLRGLATGIGRSRAVLASAVASAAVDVVASCALLLLGVGPLGVAVGTLAGAVIPLLVALIWLRRLRSAGVPVPGRAAMIRPPGREHREAWAMGLPEALMAAFAAGSTVVVTWLLAPDGAVSLATARVLDVGVFLVWTVLYGIAAAGTSMVAERLGAGDPAGLRRAVRVTATTAAAVAALCAVVLPPLTPTMLRWAIDDPRVVEAAGPLVWLAWAQVLWMAATATTNAVLRAHGDTRTPLLASTIGEYAVFLPLGWLLCRVGDLGLLGIFVCHHVFWMTFLAVGLTRLRFGARQPAPATPRPATRNAVGQ